MNENNLELPMTIAFTMLALIVVLLVAWLAIRLLAKLNRVNPNGVKAVKIRQSIAVGSRERLVIVQYRDRELLLGVTTGGISVLKDNPNNRHADIASPLSDNGNESS